MLIQPIIDDAGNREPDVEGVPEDARHHIESITYDSELDMYRVRLSVSYILAQIGDLPVAIE